MVSGESWLELSKIDPELDKTFKAMRGEPPKLGGTIRELRVLLSERKMALTTTQSNDTSRVIEEDITIPARDGYSIAARVYAPESPPAEGSPLVMILHGGGFCLGGLENEELNCRNFAQQLGCVCVNVDYRLAPEHPFPIPVHDCWDALKWVAANAAGLKAAPSRGFIVGGVSAGGNLATVVGLLARDEKLSPPLTGLYLCIPVLLSPGAIPEKYKPLYRSYEQNKDAPILPKSAIDLFMDNYKPDTLSYLFNIFTHPQGHSGLPPVYFQICGMDPLRDEALIYEKVLREDYGTKTKVDIYPGFPHAFWSFFPTLKASEKVVEDAVKGVQWLLDQSSVRNGQSV